MTSRWPAESGISGGTISVVAVEQPFSYGHKLDGPGACQYPLERVVDEVIGYVDEMRKIFPGVPVGSIEAIWKSPATTADDLALWLDTYEERSGEPFAFLHVDADWTRPDWAQVAVAIEAEADARGVPFGVLYNGGLEADGPTWLANTMDRIVELEAELGGTPQHVALQSWVDQPDRVLPDDDLGAFTSVINRYFGARSRLESSFVDDGEGSSGVAIRLTDDDGNPLAGQSISAGLRPLSGALQTHTVTGTVPAASRTAVAVVRVNVEDAGPGPADVRLAEVGYEEDGDGTNRVANADFAGGLTDWGAYGEPVGEVRVTSRDDGAGSNLELLATPDQVILVDSVPFPVTPGATYEFRVVLGVPEASIGNATVAVAFLGELEIARHSIRFEPLLEQLAPIETDANGNARIPTLDIEPGSYQLDARYPGDLERWPSATTMVVDVASR
jgi:hypothetical protein